MPLCHLRNLLPPCSASLWPAKVAKSHPLLLLSPLFQVYIFDLDIAADTILALRRKDSAVRAICYFSTQFENWR